MLPDREKLEDALDYLAKTDRSHALLFAAKDVQKERIKLVRAEKFLSATGSVAERNATADSSIEVAEAITEWENAVADFKLLENTRSRMNTVIEVWRSLNKQGRTL